MLVDKALYSPSVHCFYYGCIQFVKHCLLFKFEVSESSLVATATIERQGSHEVMINKMAETLRLKGKDWKEFNTSINQLKKLRIKADYENEQILISESQKAALLSTDILKILRSL